MRVRTLALALALSCGLGGMAEARHKPHTSKAKSARKTNPKFKQAKSRKVKPRKAVKRARQRRSGPAEAVK